MLKKILFLIVILAAGYFVYTNYITGGAGLDGVRAIDKKYSVDFSRIVPLDDSQLLLYKNDLEKLRLSGSGNDLVQMKIELAKMQLSMNKLPTITREDLANPACSSYGKFGIMIREANSAAKSAQTALSKIPAIRDVDGFDYLKSAEFESQLKYSMQALQKSASDAQKVCV